MGSTLHRTAISRRRALVLMAAGGMGLSVLPARGAAPAQGGAVKMTYPARAFITLPFWVAQEAGIYERHGIASQMDFGIHPAGIATVIGGSSQMTLYSPEQLISAQMRDPALVISSLPIQRAPFIMMGTKGTEKPADLKGKRIAIARIGDAYYYNSLAVLAKVGLTEKDVSWVPVGGDISVRIQMMQRGQVDAGFLSVQHTFALIEQGFPKIIDLGEEAGFFSPVATTHKRDWARTNPDVVRRIVMAEAEAMKLIYDDRDKAIAIYRKFEDLDSTTVGKVYDLFISKNYFERIPLITRPPIAFAVDRVAEQTPEVRSANLATLYDNSVVRSLIEQGFYTSLFGSAVKAEQDAKLASAL